MHLWKDSEQMFSERLYNGQSQPLLACTIGEFPLLLLAPHAVNHFRPDGSIKPADLCTGGLVTALALSCGVFSLANTSTHPSISPHFGIPAIEQEATCLAPHCRAIIDVHGMKDNPSFSFALGTSGVPTAEQENLLGLFQSFLSPVGRVAINPEGYRADRPGALTLRLKDVGVSSIIQLEIAHHLRHPMGESSLSASFFTQLQKLISFLTHT